MKGMSMLTRVLCKGILSLQYRELRILWSTSLLLSRSRDKVVYMIMSLMRLRDGLRRYSTITLRMEIDLT